MHEHKEQGKRETWTNSTSYCAEQHGNVIFQDAGFIYF